MYGDRNEEQGSKQRLTAAGAHVSWAVFLALPSSMTSCGIASIREKYVYASANDVLELFNTQTTLIESIGEKKGVPQSSKLR